MLRSSLALFAGLIFTLSVASAVYAQSAEQPPAPAQSSQSTQAAPAVAPQAPQKKVWTDDDMGSPHTQTGGAAGGSKASPNPNANPSAKSKNKKEAKWYQDQIARLQSQIPPLDAQIAELQSALAGNTINEPRHYGGNRIGDWKEQLEAAQTKRQNTLDKISVLEDEARHNGVSPNAIP
jgi:hypothetical protein